MAMAGKGFQIGGYSAKHVQRAWQNKGVYAQVQEYRGRVRLEGRSGKESWELAWEMYPLRKEEIEAAAKEMGKEWYQNLKAMEKRKKELKRAGLAGVVTGNAVLDWLFMNLGRQDHELLGVPPVAGAYGLLVHYREDKKNFYDKVFMPVLLKGLGGVPKGTELGEELVDGYLEKLKGEKNGE